MSTGWIIIVSILICVVMIDFVLGRLHGSRIENLEWEKEIIRTIFNFSGLKEDRHGIFLTSIYSQHTPRILTADILNKLLEVNNLEIYMNDKNQPEIRKIKKHK